MTRSSGYVASVDTTVPPAPDAACPSEGRRLEGRVRIFKGEKKEKESCFFAWWYGIWFGWLIQ